MVGLYLDLDLNPVHLLYVMVLKLSSEMYDKLVKGLTDVTIFTTAGLERHFYSNNTNFA